MRYLKDIRTLMAAVLTMTAATLTSCSEDPVETGFEDPTEYFKPESGATDSTSVIRNNFYDKYGSYLLFTDTLQHYYTGTNNEGEDVYFTEMLDLTYYVGQTNSSTATYGFTYLETMAQRLAAVEYMEKYILPHTKGSMKPFSWLLTYRINGTTNMGGTTSPYAVAGQRCAAVALYYIFTANRSDKQKQNLAQRILVALIGKLANNNADAFADFLSVSAKYYDTQMTTATSLSSSEEMALLNNAGFINSAGHLYGYYYPSQSDDLNQYATLLLQNTLEQINTKYANYPLILQKAQLMHDTMESLGYVF